MQEDQIKHLLLRYQAGKCTMEEIAFLEDWYAQWNQKLPLGLSYEELETDLKLITQNIPTLHRGRERTIIKHIIAAASVILILTVGGYFILNKQQQPKQIVAITRVSDVGPGGNKAILTLSNGQKINISNAINGKIAQQSGATITKAADGEVVYHSNHKMPDDKPIYNTITTPRGGQYKLTLADGTLAIVDAASSIKYPVVFNGGERLVEITGQVYFEVVHNQSKPFRVMVKGQVIEDLGTHFNIKAYDDEAVMLATLIEGKISVSNENSTKLLSPGQQAVVKNNNSAITLRNADIEEVIAWKNGRFMFHQENIRDLMRTVSRWYDVDVEFKGHVSQKKLGGAISKYKNITELLDNIKTTSGINYKIEGRRVILMN